MQKAAGEHVFREKEAVKPAKLYGTWDGAGEAQKLCDYLRSRGCLTIYNHPVWSRAEAEEFIDTEGLWALEIFNYGTVNESNTGYDYLSWDRMLRKGKRITAVAADDNHNEGFFDDACGGYIVVRADRLSHEEIIILRPGRKSMAGGLRIKLPGWSVHLFTGSTLSQETI